MKSANFTRALICIIFASVVIHVHAQDADSTQMNSLNFTNMGKVVLMGNSITESWPTVSPNFFRENPYLISKGISGQTTDQMLARFQKDVINQRPEVVVILAGINDIAENNDPISTVDIMENISAMVQLAQDNQIKVVLCNLVPANRFTWRPAIAPAERVIELNSMIAAYAAKNELVLVNYYDSMVDNAKGLKVELGPDGVHPNAAGYKIMEELLLAGLTKLLGVKH